MDDYPRIMKSKFGEKPPRLYSDNKTGAAQSRGTYGGQPPQV